MSECTTHDLTHEGNNVAVVIKSQPTLCDPMDCSPSGYSFHGNTPGKNTGVGCHSLLQGIFQTQGLTPGSPALADAYFTIWATSEPRSNFQDNPNPSLQVQMLPLMWKEMFQVSDKNFKLLGFPGDSVVKNLPANAGDTGLIPGSRKIPHAVQL